MELYFGWHWTLIYRNTVIVCAHKQKLRNVIQIRQIHWLLISPIAQSTQVCFTNRTPLNFTLVVFVVCTCPNVPVFRWSTHIAWNSIMTVYSTLCTFLLEQVTILFFCCWDLCNTHFAWSSNTYSLLSSLLLCAMLHTYYTVYTVVSCLYQTVNLADCSLSLCN